VRSTGTGCWALAAALALGVTLAGPAGADDCHPGLDPSTPQYIVGYGSLMQSASKLSTEPNAGSNLPVLVTGFQRAWNTHGVYPTTYLGVRPLKSARMAAALYRDFLDDGKLGADAREIDYCRVAVAPSSIEMLDSSTVPSPSQVWIYVNKPESLAPPDAENPIVQSYVDLFITGCLELQARVADPDLDFVAQCVQTTDGWSKHWVNDRPMPRRPYIYQPRAWEIDQRLKQLLPEIFETIQIE
jgi:hypothetical protein